MIEKTAPIRSKKLMAAARDRSCINCGRDDGTIVRAHYTGYRQHQYGKGRGIKGHDLLAADLCMECHASFDRLDMGEDVTENNNTIVKTIDQSEKFLHCIALTLVRDFKAGLIKV